MICFFFLNGAPPIRLNIFGAPPSFVAAARCICLACCWLK